MSDLEYRSAELASVDFPTRMVEVIVTPWEQETVVEHKGRIVREVFTRGAYDGVETRPNRIKVNRDHNRERSVGKVVVLHPSRDEGLVAEIRISRTALGDETLELADDGVLDASAEFAVMTGGETWEGKLRRITKAFLGGVAFTSEPAYPGANVLSVRATPATVEETTTPNLDKLEILRLRGLYAALDRKYSLR